MFRRVGLARAGGHADADGGALTSDVRSPASRQSARRSTDFSRGDRRRLRVADPAPVSAVLTRRARRKSSVDLLCNSPCKAWGH
jgi:hypothetical protein